ncbi:uncharacterized protein LOC132278403 [Cornus florida]|uniref:uncharacterized protein LOC132278403 n=1 Tax=Cornus florida TaxID=4283 RepID=UPI002896CBB5|nr:uncharacterized protein LOC132278403 [Cornus florida]
MESEPNPPVRAKKLWKIIRVVFYMLSKGISKNKLMDDLNTMMKRGQIAGKSMGNLMNHNYSALTCRPDDPHLSFISPQEYEFSFRNSPAYPSYHTRRKHHHLHSRHHHRHLYHNADVVQKVFDMLNSEVPEASPVSLPGFGRSPMVRQLRVTDSPFSVKGTEDHASCDQINKAAEDFINKFYKELKQQKKMAALQSPSPYHLWAG